MQETILTIAQVHKTAGQSGIALIGIHTAGGKIESIQGVLDEFEMRYPIVIESPDPGNSGGAFLPFTACMEFHMPPLSMLTAKFAAHGHLANYAKATNWLSTPGYCENERP